MACILLICEATGEKTTLMSGDYAYYDAATEELCFGRQQNSWFVRLLLSDDSSSKRYKFTLPMPNQNWSEEIVKLVAATHGLDYHLHENRLNVLCYIFDQVD